MLEKGGKKPTEQSFPFYFLLSMDPLDAQEIPGWTKKIWHSVFIPISTIVYLWEKRGRNRGVSEDIIQAMSL